MIREIVIWLQPFIQWIGKLRVPYSRKRITGKEYYQLRDEIKPGCVLLTSTCGELSNIINPSEYKHGAIYIGSLYNNPPKKGDIKYVIHSTSKGVEITDLVSFMLTKDKIRVLEPQLEPEFMENMIEAARTYVGKPYDYHWKLNNDAYYCFEFPMIALDTHKVLGYHAFTSDTFLLDARFQTVVDWE
jgi:hypothetical protein